MHTPASASWFTGRWVSSTGFPHRFAMVSMGKGLRSSMARATSAISSVTTQLRTLYSGAFSSRVMSMATGPLIFFASLMIFFLAAISHSLLS